jgi:hypothetical protein
MKNFYLILIVALTLSTSLFAQQPGISIGGNVYFPVGDWAEFANIGYGGSATYEQMLGNNVTGVLYTGYTYFGGDEEGWSYSMVPLLVGAKFYFSPKMDWYLGGLIGVNFVTAKTIFAGNEISASSTEFAGNLNFGYEVKTSEKGAVDISAGFVYINELSYFGMRLAYIFKL